MAGLAFRFQNASNFYVVRASALGHNLRFYKMVNGQFVESKLSRSFSALVRADTPHWLLMAGLLVFGFFRSLQFTCMNTLGYSDLSDTTISKGSSIASVGQQLSQSFGVAIGATILALLSGDARAPAAADFVPAFIAVGLLPLISVAFFVRLGREDGSQISGYHSSRA